MKNLLHDTFGEAANLVLTVIHFKNEYIRVQNSLFDGMMDLKKAMQKELDDEFKSLNK